MQVWALWHGGSSYSPPERGDLEEFESLCEAGEEFRRRATGWGEFVYVEKPPADYATPVVGTEPAESGGPSMRVYLRDPREERETGDAYSDRIVEFGPHGGLRITPIRAQGGQQLYGYTNEAGEPIMSGEAWRTEQALDMREPPCDPDQYLAHDEDDEDDEDDEEKTSEIPVVGYQCGMCDKAFPPGVTGHTDNNPCCG